MKKKQSSPPSSPAGARVATPTSRSLIAKARAHDDEAWRRLLGLYSPLIQFWCRKMQVPVQDIPDVSQGVFQAVATNIASFHREAPGDSFRAWLRAITRSKAIDYHRARGRQPAAAGGSTANFLLSQFPDEVSNETPSDSLAGEESHVAPGRTAILQAALEFIEGEVHGPTWRAFWKVVVEGRAPADVAAELGMTPGAVRVAKCRVLARLRAELGEFELGPDRE